MDKKDRLEEQVKVSVVCMTYNHERYIRDALEGFVKQKTDFKYEVIVHDDASTDRTADIIREYEEKYPDIIKGIYQKENLLAKKIPKLKNYIIPRISGKYVAICEGDDYWIDDSKLQKQYTFLEENEEYSLACCSSKTLNCVTNQFDDRFVVNADTDITMRDLILEKNGRLFQTGSVLMRRDVYTDRQAWQSVFPYGDRPLWMRASLDGKIRMMKDVMTVYRYLSDGSWTKSVLNDDERIALISKKVIAGFEAFDSATNELYHQFVVEAIEPIEFSINVAEHNFGEVKDSRIYLSKNRIEKYKIKLHCTHPVLFKHMIEVKYLFKTIVGKGLSIERK